MHQFFDIGVTLVPGLPYLLLTLFVAGLVISALGFFRVVWFISIGYGYSVAAMAVITIISVRNVPFSAALVLLWIHGIVLIVYGIRLSTFLAVRDAAKSFRHEADATKEMSSRTRLSSKFGIWFGVSVLYVTMVSPLVFHGLGLTTRIAGPNTGRFIITVLGLLISLGGLAIESVADLQKSSAKKKEPGKFCDTGLYRVVRFPNYFGEMMVWTGSWIAAIPFYTYWIQWPISLAGVLIILLIMMGSAKRLELKQQKSYGTIPEFVKYTKTVPAIFPFIPLYSLETVWFAIGESFDE